MPTEKEIAELKAKARALRNKPPANSAFAPTDMVSGKKRDNTKGSQTTAKAARKPSV